MNPVRPPRGVPVPAPKFTTTPPGLIHTAVLMRRKQAFRNIGAILDELHRAASAESVGACSRQCTATVKPRAISESRSGASFTFDGRRW